MQENLNGWRESLLTCLLKSTFTIHSKVMFVSHINDSAKSYDLNESILDYSTKIYNMCQPVIESNEEKMKLLDKLYTQRDVLGEIINETEKPIEEEEEEEEKEEEDNNNNNDNDESPISNKVNRQITMSHYNDSPLQTSDLYKISQQQQTSPYYNNVQYQQSIPPPPPPPPLSSQQPSTYHPPAPFPPISTEELQMLQNSQQQQQQQSYHYPSINSMSIPPPPPPLPLQSPVPIPTPFTESQLNGISNIKNSSIPISTELHPIYSVDNNNNNYNPLQSPPPPPPYSPSMESLFYNNINNNIDNSYTEIPSNIDGIISNQQQKQQQNQNQLDNDNESIVSHLEPINFQQQQQQQYISGSDNVYKDTNQNNLMNNKEIATEIFVNEIQFWKKKYEEIKNQIENYENVSNSLSLTDKQVQYNELLLKYHKLEETIYELKAIKDICEREKQNKQKYEKQCEKYKGDINKLNRRISDLKDANESYNREIEHLHQTLSKLPSDSSNVMSQLVSYTKNIHSLQKEINNLKQQYNEMSLQNISLRDKLEISTQENGNLTLELANYKNDLDKMKRQYQNLQDV